MCGGPYRADRQTGRADRESGHLRDHDSRLLRSGHKPRRHHHRLCPDRLVRGCPAGDTRTAPHRRTAPWPAPTLIHMRRGTVAGFIANWRCASKRACRRRCPNVRDQWTRRPIRPDRPVAGSQGLRADMLLCHRQPNRHRRDHVHRRCGTPLCQLFLLQSFTSPRYTSSYRYHSQSGSNSTIITIERAHYSYNHVFE